ncbi:DNA helicase, partial [Tanacetum coccineum]
MLNAYSKSLKDFGLPMPPEDMLLILQNRLLMEETNYDQELLLQEKNFLLPRLNKEQRLKFDEITNAVRSNTQRLIFVYGHGGTGKTFIWKAVTCDPDETDSENTFNVNMPPELCIPDSDTTLASLIIFIYDQKTLQMPTPKDLQNKVIVCPKNENADMINAHVLSLVNRQQHVYLNLDEAMPHRNDGGETELLYPPEYLNSLNFAGFPPHRLELKVGAPIILLRNLNISGGLCNGTRLIVTQLLNKVIEARIITGTRISEKVFLPRIPLINRDLQLPFIFKRKQFPIKLCYAMTINKSQGQSLERIGIFLPQPVFAHGQFIMTEANNPNIIPMEKGKLPLVEANTGNAIQANMDLRDTDYFNDLLQLNNAYTSIIPISNADFPEHYFNFIAYNEVNQRADINGAPLIDYIGCIYRISDPIRTGDATSQTYPDLINPVPALEIQRQPYSNPLLEQTRNRYSIEALLSVNPQHYE